MLFLKFKHQGSSNKDDPFSSSVPVKCSHRNAVGSNAKNLSVYLSLSQLAKTFFLSYYFLCLIINKIGEEDRTGLPGSKGGEGEREKMGGQGGEMAQTMYAHMNK
jgi:hypothetical protein